MGLIFCSRFSNSLVYYGMTLSTPSLGSDPYLAFFLSGLVEIPANIYTMWAIQHFGGRKLTFIGGVLISGFACVIIGFVRKFNHSF